MVYVETMYPTSELTSGYQAEKAKKSVGLHDWNGGKLILSRWDKPVRIVPWEEVADDWVKEFGNKPIHFDIVPPALLPILAERGANIVAPHRGMGEECVEAYEEWKEMSDAVSSIEKRIDELNRSIHEEQSPKSNIGNSDGRYASKRNTSSDVGEKNTSHAQSVASSGTKVEITSENRKEINKNLSELAKKLKMASYNQRL